MNSLFFFLFRLANKWLVRWQFPFFFYEPVCIKCSCSSLWHMSMGMRVTMLQLSVAPHTISNIKIIRPNDMSQVKSISTNIRSAHRMLWSVFFFFFDQGGRMSKALLVAFSLFFLHWYRIHYQNTIIMKRLII